MFFYSIQYIQKIVSVILYYVIPDVVQENGL